MPELIEPELSFRITGLCFRVQKELGRFSREKQYADRLDALLKVENYHYQRESELIRDTKTGNIPDFLIEDRIVVDLKAKPFITKEDYNQMQRYLLAADKKLGLIINFRSFYLKPKRVINFEYDKIH